MMVLVWLVYASFGFATGSMAPLVAPIMADLAMTNAQMGLVLGAWQLVYIASSGPLGTMVDRLGPRRAIALGMSVGLLSMLARGLSPNFAVLFATVALFGVGGPVVSIGAPKVVSLWLRGSERGIAAGLYATAPVVGSAFALFTAPNVVVPLFGTWRGISVFYSLLMAVILAAWWMLARDAPDTMRATPSAKGVDGRGSVLELLANRNVQVILLLAFGAFLLNHGLGNWLPTLLQERGFGSGAAGTWIAFATLFSAVGMFTLPALAKRGRRVAMLTFMLFGAAATTAGLASLVGPGLLAVIFASSALRAPLMPVLTLVLMETPGVGARRMGTAAGLFFAAAEVGGFSGPFFLGAVRDATGSLTAGMLAFAGIVIPMLLLTRLLQEPDTDDD
jgi:cyanate permease